MKTFLPKSTSILPASNIKLNDKMMRIITILFLLLPFSLFAQTKTWVGANNGTWSTAGNWSPSGVPNASNDVVFNTSRTVNIDAPTTVKSISISNASAVLLQPDGASRTITINTAGVGLSIAAGGTLTLNGSNQGGGRTLTITSTSASSSIAGTLNVTAIGAATSFTSNGTITVTGTINYTGGTLNLSGSTLSFASGSTYQHGVNGGTIPTATWNANSTCRLTGVTTTAPGGLAQNFGHFTYDCTGHSGIPNFNSQLTSIAGNFTVLNAGQKQGTTRTLNGLALASTIDATINIGGNLVIDNFSTEASWLIMATGDADITMNIGGNFIMANSGGQAFVYFDYKWGTGTTMGNLVVSVAGNLDISGGANLDMGFQASGYTVPAELRLSGNLKAAGGFAIVTSAMNVANGKIVFQKNGLQTINEVDLGSIRYVDFQVNSNSILELLSDILLWEYPLSAAYAIKSGDFVVLNNGTVDLNTFILHNYRATSGTPYTQPGAYSTFILNENAHLITARSLGVHIIGAVGGSISAAIATRTFNSGANYTFDGVVAQNSGTFTTTPDVNTVRNLTISNTSGVASTGVTLQQPFFVNGTLSLNQGHVTSTQTNLLTLNGTGTLVGGSDNSFVNGPMAKVSNSSITDNSFTFPVGKLNHGMRTIGVSSPTAHPTTFNAEFIRANPRTLYPFTPIINVLANISGCEYWHLNRTAGTGNARVTLSWSPLSNCNGTQYVLVPTSLVVARYNNTTAPFNWTSEGRGSYSSVPPFASGTITSAAEVTTFRDGVAAQTPFTLGTVVFNNVLNVNNIQLQANRTTTQTQLQFLNHNEANVSRYEVLYSQNGINFEKISEVLPIKNNGKESSYNLSFPNKAGATHYFRVKTIELENKNSFSNTVQLNSISADGIQILSNPVTNKTLRFVLNEMPQGAYTAQLINSNGQVAYQNAFNHSSSTAPYTMQLAPSLPIGMYNLIITGSEGRFTKTILIQ